jgi:hypothetical protein
MVNPALQTNASGIHPPFFIFLEVFHNSNSSSNATAATKPEGHS